MLIDNSILRFLSEIHNELWNCYLEIDKLEKTGVKPPPPKKTALKSIVVIVIDVHKQFWCWLKYSQNHIESSVINLIFIYRESLLRLQEKEL